MTGKISLVLAAVLAILVISGCTMDTGTDRPTELDAVEIKEYEGEDLSSINEFRENSIKCRKTPRLSFLIKNSIPPRYDRLPIKPT